MSALLFFQKELANLVKKEEETFKDNETEYTIIGVAVSLLNLFILGYAIFLSFQRNQEFNLGSFLAACCCSICYIIYAFAVPVRRRKITYY